MKKISAHLRTRSPYWRTRPNGISISFSVTSDQSFVTHYVESFQEVQYLKYVHCIGINVSALVFLRSMIVKGLLSRVQN